MHDELCEVAEICSGMSLISSAIVSCGVHHLRETDIKLSLFVFRSPYMPHLDCAFYTVRDLPGF